MTKFHLYFDESGNFNSEDAHDNYYDSQIAGVLIYASNSQADFSQINNLAKEILDNSFQQSYPSLPPKEVYHGSSLAENENYSVFINAIIENITKDNRVKKNWQPIRLVNQEEVGYGHQEDNYLFMIAELVFKIAQEKHKEGFNDLNFNLYPARRNVNQEEYRKRLNSLEAILKVHQELSFSFTVDKITPIPAEDNYLLQISDLLSNASYKNYNKCNQDTKNNLKEAFGQYNFTLIVPLFEQRTESLIQEGSYGLALRFILLKINSKEHQNRAKEFLAKIIENLASLPPAERNAHLNYLISWLEQEINQKRDLEKGYKLAEKLDKYVYQILKDKLQEIYQQDNSAQGINSILWFKYALHFWALTAYNHSGKLYKGEQEAIELTLLQSQLYQQVEYLSLLMEGLVAKAVHYTDCFEFEKAIKECEFVIDFYDYFGDEMAKFFTDYTNNIAENSKDNQIKSKLRAEANGTCLQAQIYQYLQTPQPQLLEKARKNNERAIAEFIGVEDKRRQYQYRCQLETVAGNISEAKKYLAKGLGLADDSCYLTIIEHIQKLEQKYQGFPLLHLFRLGYACYLNNKQEEWENFKDGLNKSKLFNNDWCGNSKINNYPIHGILRRVVSFALIMGDKNKARQTLGNLTNLKPIQQSLILGLVELATYIEYAALFWEGKNTAEFANIIQRKNNKKVSILSLINELKRNGGEFEKIAELITNLTEILSKINDNKIVDVKNTLLNFANKIGY